MTSKSSKNFYTFGCIALAIALTFILSACSDSEPESKPAASNDAAEETTTSETTEQETTEVVTKDEVTEPASTATETDTPTATENDQGTPAEGSTPTVSDSNQDTPAETTKPPISPMLFNSFVEGEHYITKFPNDTLAKEPTVIEFFSYQCPHCYRLEGTIKRWQRTHKPENVKFIQVPVSFPGNTLYENAAVAHYVAEKLGLMATFPERMFKRIHIDRRPVRNERDMANFFAEFGVSKEDFDAARNSFEVKSKLRRADVLTRKYQVSGVPYILVNYKHELGQKAWESEQTLFNVWSNLPLKDFQ